VPIKPQTLREPSQPSTFDLLLSTIPAMRQMPRREIKVLKREPYSLCLKQMGDVLHDDEPIETVTCAISASRGRGVLVMTDRRLVLITLRTGTCDWSLSELDGVRGRAAKFTLPAAIYLDTPGGTIVIVVGDGPVWGPQFTEAVRGAHARQPLAQAA